MGGDPVHPARDEDEQREDGMAEQNDVVDNTAEGRYELAVDGKTAVLGYTRREGTLYLTHTEVPEELEGQGIGSRIVKHVLDRARADGVKVAPWCPFVRAYIDRHPEYEDLVAAGE
jgi:uncharacterized protein